MKTGRNLRLWLALIALGLLSRSPSAQAYFLNLPSSLPAEVLSESVPMVLFPPNEFTAEDFRVEWSGQPIEGVDIRVGKESFQWVRVSEVLLLPRGRVLLQARNAQSGQASYAGFTATFDSEKVGGQELLTAEVPVALISGDENAIDVKVVRGGREVHGKVRVKYQPRPRREETLSRQVVSFATGVTGFTGIPEPQDRWILRDPACSRFGLEVESTGAREDEWVYIGCRSAVVGGDEHRTTALELYVFWDNVGQVIQVNGIDTPAKLTSLWPMRLRSHPGVVTLRAGAHQMKIRYRTPEQMHLFSMSMGLGPYSYNYDGRGELAQKPVIPLLTLYGSFFLNETFRVVGFNATAFADHGFSDLGIYLYNENMKFFDRRLTINLLLGAHAIGFRSRGQTVVLFGAPQGFEVVYTDFLKRGYNVSLGGFVYPPIAGKSYNNIWLRWGGRMFAEINYISWQERLEEERIASRSLGLSVGFPLFKLF